VEIKKSPSEFFFDLILTELSLLVEKLLIVWYSSGITRTAVALWLKCCATNRKDAGSIPAGVIGFFIDIKSFQSHYGVDSASKKNEYQEYFLRLKAAGV